MKRTLLLFLCLLLQNALFSQNDPVIMEIDGEKVTKSEFLQIYLKNNNDPKYDKQSLDEYMELFKKFKLKVAEAEALGYDTIPKLAKELEGYKRQLATPYLTDSAMNEYLVKEAYERTINEVRASHILIRVEPNASPADTLVAYNRIMALRKEIEGGADFATVARGKTGSEDPSAKSNGGDLGFFTAFQMVSSFEDAAYSTPVGKMSMPFRTKFGYHILKVTDARKARGTMNAAHIMIAANSNAGDDEIESARKKINELYEKLKSGEDFEELAKQFSDDPSTANRGGVLPAFGTGTTTRMVTNFEEAAFAIPQDGQYSAPIQTDYGFHIIKRISLTPVQTYEQMKKDLQGRVNRDERAKKTQDSFVKKLKEEYHFKAKSPKRLKWFIENVDSSLYYKGSWTYDQLKSNKTLFKLDKKKFKQKDFAEYLRLNYRAARVDFTENMIKSQYQAFEKQTVLDYEESKLEGKYPAFKALMQEYHDGILLYEVMTDKVWNKAMKDTAGMNVFFQNNRDNYRWNERFDALVYECLNADIANQVYKMVQNDTINSKHVIDKINKDSELNLKVRTNKFDPKEVDYLKDQNLKKGVNKPYEYNDKFYVVKVDTILPPAQKVLSEAKGAVTSDYQNYLEEEWLKELKAKHPITIHSDVLYSLGK